MNSKRDHKSVDNTYGDVRYRFSYDDSRRAAAVRTIRRSKRGPRSFWLTVCVVGVFCLSTVGVAAVYRNMDKKKVFSQDEDERVPEDIVPVNAFVVTEERKNYPGRFTVSDMTERAKDVYHIPDGIIVSDTRRDDSQFEEDKLNDGDIITEIDGVSTHDIPSFDKVFSSEKESFRLSIFRKGRHITIDYVKYNEE